MPTLPLITSKLLRPKKPPPKLKFSQSYPKTVTQMPHCEPDPAPSHSDSCRDKELLGHALQWGGKLLLGGALSGIIILAHSLLYAPDPTTLSIFELNSFATMIGAQVVQDFPSAALSAFLLLLLSWRLKYLSPLTAPFSARVVTALAATLVLAIAYLGFVSIYRRFPLSADEFWVLFDAAVFQKGHLLARLAPEWRDYASALQPVFRLEMPQDFYLISSYLPMNAAIQALLGTVMPSGMGVAFLASIAVVALFGVARQIWPDRQDAAIVAVILMASSPQFLITAMTPFAMTAHLTLNLIWLWLFLKSKPWTHASAIGVAFVATGLHQIVFHPLFAAPFVLSLWLSRHYRLATLHTVAYAVIGIFWVLYWKLALIATGDVPHGMGEDLGLSSFAAKVLSLINTDVADICTMVLNIIRFAAWQNPILIALLILGTTLRQRWRDPLTPTALGVIVTLAALLVLMPYAAHSWGYRYLHGLLGSVALLATHGWVQVTSHSKPSQTWGALSICTLFTLGTLFPIHALQVDRVVKPRATAARTIESTEAEVVIVDGRGIQFGWDLVRNDPFLQKAPIVLLLEVLNEGQLQELCKRHSIAIYDHKDAKEVGIKTGLVEDPNYFPENSSKRRLMRALGCGGSIADYAVVR